MWHCSPRDRRRSTRWPSRIRAVSFSTARVGPISQASAPLQNPNEMDDLVHNVGSPDLVVKKVASGPSAGLFQQVFGADVFSQPTGQVFLQITMAIAAFEATPEVSPFTSRYDAFVAGKGTLSPSEMNGLRLFTGSTSGRPGGPANSRNANCVICHVIPSDPTTGPDLFSASTYHNTGVPKNPNNPFYKQTAQRPIRLGSIRWGQPTSITVWA